MINVASFDIFDTCLTRAYAHPVDVFHVVGQIAAQKGWISQTPDEFYWSRISAEGAARKLTPSREISIGDIYRQLAAELGLTPSVAAQIQQVELTIEEQTLQPILETRERIDQARKAGRRILFLSDMYLPSSLLQRLLQKHEFYREGDLLYVSGEVGYHKGDGSLFHHARRQLEKEVTRWSHFGDNPHSDVKIPHSLGMDVEHFEDGLLNRYELQACPQKKFHTKVLSRLLRITGLDRVKQFSGEKIQGKPRETWRSHFGGAMRLSRLSKPAQLSSREKMIWDAGVNVSGPILYGYVKWVLDQAKQQGVSRLYFVARDGQIMLEIARVIQSIWPDSIECRYLYGSRHAWVLPALRELDDYHLGWILEPTPGLSLRQVFPRIEIAPEDHRELLESAGFPEDQWGEPLSVPQREHLRKLLQEPALSTAIKAVAKEKREGLLHYLRNEGLFDQDKIGMVDLGGNGSLKQALAQICEQAPDPIKPRVFGFYFGLVRTRLKRDGDYYGYINTVCPKSVDGFTFYCGLLEAFTSADHGQTWGYKDGQPVLARPDNPAVTKWGLSILREGMLTFSRTYCALDIPATNHQPFLEAALLNMELFFEKPTLAEVELWGSFPASAQRVETELIPILPPWTKREVRAKLFTWEGRKKLWWLPAMARKNGMISLHIYYQMQKLWRYQIKPRLR